MKSFKWTSLLSKNNNDQTPTTLILCPYCKKHIPDLAFHGFNGQISVYIKCQCAYEERKMDLTDFIEHIKRPVINKGKCERHSNKADQYCPDCSMWLCSDCLSWHSKFARQHNLITSEINVICKEHSKSFNGYCSSCRNNICIECYKKHQTHDILPIKTVDFKSIYTKHCNTFDGSMKRNKEATDKFIQVINKKIDELIKRLEQLNELKNDIQVLLTANEVINEDLKVLYKTLYTTAMNFGKYPSYQLSRMFSVIKANEDHCKLDETKIELMYLGLKRFLKTHFILTLLPTSPKKPVSHNKNSMSQSNLTMSPSLMSTLMNETSTGGGGVEKYEKIGMLSTINTKMVIDWISPSKIIKFKLLYNPTNGHDTSKECFKNCYDKFPLVILIESDNQSVFGGYTSVGWNAGDNRDAFKNDSKAFLFSITNKYKYPIKKELCNKAIKNDKEKLLNFFCGLYLENHFYSSVYNWNKLDYYGDDEPEFELNQGKEYFQVKRLYVYQVIYGSPYI